MKSMKKIVSIVLALIMVMGMSTTVFAADEQTYTITINNEAEGHTYEAYQVFTGDLHEGVLSNIEWGSGVSADVQNVFGSAAKKAEAIGSETDAAAFAKDIAPYLAAAAGTANKPVNGQYVISGLAPGYYLVKDAENTLVGANDARTAYILKVVADVEATPKSGTIIPDKKVKDTNDTTGDTSEWQDSADYDVNDEVPFQLSATMPSDYANYAKYKLVFHDTQSEGLTFDKESVNVYVDETEITTGYEVVTDGLEDGCTFEVVFANLKTIEAVKAGTVITVEYMSTLNEAAVIGSAGNTNTMKLEFSNDPNYTGSGDGPTGKTPKETVVVFTYKAIVNKVDQNGEALTGAGFTLYKYDAAAEGEDKYVAVGNEVKGEALTTFTWNGLDDGNYKLVETTTPAGYNTIDPIEFAITAEHDVLSADPKLTGLDAGEFFTAEKESGIISADIENVKGSTLPSTGGMGTTIIYIAGAMLILGAGAALIMRRRRAEEN